LFETVRGVDFRLVVVAESSVGEDQGRRAWLVSGQGVFYGSWLGPWRDRQTRTRPS
jgi:hypothetical protein